MTAELNASQTIPNGRAPSLEALGMTKIFGPLVALDDVSIRVEAGSFHALLGENGAGKSTLVKCIMGFYSPDKGKVLLDGKDVAIRSPRDARANGIGMVYQHFTLVPCLTAAENLVISRADAPAVIDWGKEKKALAQFMEQMPFRVPLDAQVSSLSAGEKQKLEILKLLYLDQRFMILDEPTSVLTPGEADEMLGLLGDMARRKEITVPDMSAMMIGDTAIRERAARQPQKDGGETLELAGIFAEDNEGLPVVKSVNLKVKAGEIVGIAGVSGNGQSALVEVLSGQRPLADGAIFIGGKRFEPKRKDYDRYKVFGLPEEPLKNAAVPKMSVAENIAFRSFDKPPVAKFGWWMSPGPMREKARELIAKYRVKTQGPDAPIETLSGGNVQRAILARELSGDVDVLIVANPCFGLDFASVADIRSQIMDQRNRGAAVLLVSEDLDEILELADRVAVMSGGTITYVSPIEATDRNIIGQHMAGH
jgi:simple sugar transport system ATP-binding protein